MNEIVVTAVGADRPGIVAAITGALLELGGNLEETRAALLRGSFATVLAVAVPQGVGRDELQAALRPVALELGLGLWVGDATPRTEAPPLPRAVVSVYGADHPGIVHAAASAVAGQDCNITDLNARLGGEAGAEAIYVLMMEVAAPPDRVEGLRGALEEVGRREGVEVSVRELEHDEL